MTTPAPGPVLGRRTVLVAGAAGVAGLLAGCGGGGGGTPDAGSPLSEPVITDLERLRSEGALSFEAEQGRAVLVALDDEVVAFDSRCTHQNCTVAFDRENRELRCPCHGSRFDPADGGAVLGGPAPAPLRRVEVVVDEAEGVVRRV
jgi:cytochrome b6-f complex iron-sulfur subunit